MQFGSPKHLFADQSATRTCCVRAPRHAGCDQSKPYRRVPHRQGTRLFRCKAVLRRASCGIQLTADLPVCTRAIAPLRSLSMERRHSTRACDARALYRAGCSRSVSYERPSHRQEASIIQCKVVLLRASYGLQN